MLTGLITGSPNHVYNGLNDISIEGSWVWSDGNNPSYTHWAQGKNLLMFVMKAP